MRKHFKISDLPKVKEEFREVFKMSYGQFNDNLMTATLARLIIDIVKFDDAIRKAHPSENSLALNELIQKHYKDVGINLIDKLT